MANSHHILLIACEDRKGLVHHLTGVLYHSGLNIIVNHEFVDRETHRFFMRTECAGDINPGVLLEELRAALPADAHVILAEKRKKKIVVLVTKEEHCLGDLLIKHEYNRLNAHILAVIGNHDLLRPLVERFGLPFYHVPHVQRTREEHEAAISVLLDGFQPDYVILAKYMRILTNGFIERYPERIINIHHSFLPAFVGADPYRQAYERGVKIIGATAHFATSGLDEGPIIEQSIIPVNHSHGTEDMRQAGKDVENAVLAKALRLAFEDRIFVTGNKTVIFD